MHNEGIGFTELIFSLINYSLLISFGATIVIFLVLILKHFKIKNH